MAVKGEDGAVVRDPLPMRPFRNGDFRYVVLDLLRCGPAHGYELMRALEERFRGLYSPSPGVIYPTLQLLEDLGYVGVERRGDKKVCSITPEGLGFLEEHRRQVDVIWQRAGLFDPELMAELHDMRHELRDLVQSMARRIQEGKLDRRKLHRVREAASGFVRDSEDLLAEGDLPGRNGAGPG